MRIGVLALQGAFIEHIAVLKQLGIEAVEVRLPAEMDGLDGLIIPGGESTTISNLMAGYGLDVKIAALVKDGFPVWGTCAGMILLSADTQNSVRPLKLIDITIKRNAFGRQRESFQEDLYIPALGEKPFPAIFIRAPLIEHSNGKVTVLARLANGTAVAARQGRVLVTAFHPELTGDPRFHAYFRDIVAGRQ